jgi:hypothetical protein
MVFGVINKEIYIMVDIEKFREKILIEKVPYIIATPFLNSFPEVNVCDDENLGDLIQTVLKNPKSIEIRLKKDALPIWENLVEDENIPVYRIIQEDDSFTEICLK